MRRRSHLVVAFVALVTVGWNVVTTQPGGSALAADPQAELQRTRAQLADAKSAQQALSATLERQRSELAELEHRSAQLDTSLDLARAELATVTAEYERVRGLLAQVKRQVRQVERHLAELNGEIERLSRQLEHIAAAIERRTEELREREALLEDHLRSAYERSQTSMLEILLSADSLDEVTRQFGYLITVSDQDAILADEIRSIREELGTRRASLRDGRRVLAQARALAREEEAKLKSRRVELSDLGKELAALRVVAEVKRAEQEAALNASLAAEGDVERKIAQNERAARAAAALAATLQQQAAAQQAAIEEARRRAAEEARRQAAAQAAANKPSAYGFRWPERSFQVTQEWGPTSFQLEPPYTYKGTYYPHFHAGIDFAGGCGTPIYAAGAGVVVASGQPLMPFDTGFGVVIDHGDGIQTWYWHMQPGVVVTPGTIVTGNSVIGYEGTTGMSTGCHVHFAVNDGGWWENPRRYLP
jgi:murein DD-endopeptidase MepM/ murein hydrolase activator NlpD